MAGIVGISHGYCRLWQFATLGTRATLIYMFRYLGPTLLLSLTVDRSDVRRLDAWPHPSPTLADILYFNYIFNKQFPFSFFPLLLSLLFIVIIRNFIFSFFFMIKSPLPPLSQSTHISSDTWHVPSISHIHWIII